MVSTLCAFYIQFVVTASTEEWRSDVAPLIMAQMTQESACKRRAQSPYAHGLMQFTPATAKDMGKTYCKHLGKVKVYNEEWSIRCGIRYDRHLYNRMAEYSPDRERFAAMLSAYNGGRGWTNRDNRVCQKLDWCDPTKWFGHVELTPDTRRAQWAIKENRGYPKRILGSLLARYEAHFERYNLNEVKK